MKPIRHFWSRSLLLAIFGACGPLSGPASARSWVINGVEAEAELVLNDPLKQTATLRLPKGQEVTIPWARFGEDDQAFLRGARPPPPPGTGVKGWVPEWPGDVNVGTTIEVEEQATGSGFAYETPHFRFESPVELGKVVVREFARLFEAVYVAVDSVPFRLRPQPPRGRFPVRLFETREAYHAAGGIPGSAGCYRGGERDVLVPLQSLGVKKVGERYALDDADGNQTLLHEIAHQMMHAWLPRMKVWMSEGWAEFFAAQRYRAGRMSFANPGRNLADYLRESRGAFDGKMAMVSPLDLMAISDDEWEAALSSPNRMANTNYASAAVLVTYFLLHDGDGKAMWDYLRAVEKGAPAKDAQDAFLVRGRTREALEKDVESAMSRYALKLEFLPKSGGE